jgi:hypothetical protein
VPPPAGLPNPNFRNQEFFVKNQELIRRLFLENQEVWQPWPPDRRLTIFSFNMRKRKKYDDV